MARKLGVSVQAVGKRSVTRRHTFLKVKFGIRMKDEMPREETAKMMRRSLSNTPSDEDHRLERGEVETKVSGMGPAELW